MWPNLPAKFLAVGTLSLLMAGCSQFAPSSSSSLGAHSADTTLQHHADIKGIMLSGVIEYSEAWTLHLATPVAALAEPSSVHRYSVRINDSDEHIAVTVSEVAKGPLHFSTVIANQSLPIRQLTFYDNGRPLHSIENEQVLPPTDDLASLLKLEVQQDQICLTWPDDLFAQAGLLSVNTQRRLQLQKQSSVSPLCVEADTAEPVGWRVNLRNPMFAIQFTTNS